MGLLSLVVSACGMYPQEHTEIAIPPMSTVEPTPLPTETALDQPTDTPEPFSEMTSAIVIESPQDLETPTPLPPGVNMPLEQLAIYEPGPGSQVTSGFRINGWGGPSFDDRVLIRLLGEDGGVLSRGWRYLYVLSGNPGRFNGTIYFNIDHVAEEARLEISMQSWRDRQTTHISTVNLTLLSTGSALVHPARRGTEKLAIFSPHEGGVVSGGVALVQGAGWVDSDTPLSVDIINNRGDSLGSAQVELDAPAVGQLGTFSVEVPYQIDFQQWVHITVYEPSTGSIPGIIHLTSVEVWLIQ
ncbi:MAG: hypothetical protein P8Y98_05040 [Anaerolineales bacterium]